MNFTFFNYLKTESKILLVTLLVTTFSYSFSQTCTVTGTSPLNWANPGPNCSEGGNAGGKTTLIIPVGFTLDFDSNGDTWAGTTIQIYGTLIISKDVRINSNIIVENGGLLRLQSKLELGPSVAGCGFTLTIRTGGVVDVGGTGSDRLSICGVELMKGNGACNSCGGTNSGKCVYDGKPYCEPATGFVGPLGYAEGGYDSTLPIKLLYFVAELSNHRSVNLEWVTSTEENFDRFILERSISAVDFEPIYEVQGFGRDIFSVENKYRYEDEKPILGNNYYRLKAIDLDGSVEYFGVRVVKLTGPKHLFIYPNPSSGNSISFGINFNPSENDQVLIVNSFGVELARLSVKQTENNIKFANELSSGVYILKYISTNFQLTSRLLVR